MLERLRRGEATPHDLRFFEHETIEAGLMKHGAGAREAHLQTLEKQGIPYQPGYEAQLYHPDVIEQFKAYFNQAAWPK
jgi:hypothetical protein